MSLTIKEALRDNNLSVTKQRLLVFNVLGKHYEPISIKQLHDLTKESVDRVSLYRIVEVFENANIIKRVQIGWKYKLELSDQFHVHHHHLTCRNCEKTISFQEPPALDVALRQLSEKHNFSIETHSLEIQGLCATCAQA